MPDFLEVPTINSEEDGLNRILQSQLDKLLRLKKTLETNDPDNEALRNALAASKGKSVDDDDLKELWMMSVGNMETVQEAMKSYGKSSSNDMKKLEETRVKIEQVKVESEKLQGVRAKIVERGQDLDPVQTQILNLYVGFAATLERLINVAEEKMKATV